MERGAAAPTPVEHQKVRPNTTSEGVLYATIGAWLRTEGKKTNQQALLDAGARLGTVAAFSGENGENLPIGATFKTCLGGDGKPVMQDGQPVIQTYVIVGVKDGRVRIRSATQKDEPEITIPLAALREDAERNAQAALAANPEVLKQAGVSDQAIALMRRYSGVDEVSAQTTKPGQPVTSATSAAVESAPVVDTPSVTPTAGDTLTGADESSAESAASPTSTPDTTVTADSPEPDRADQTKPSEPTSAAPTPTASPSQEDTTPPVVDKPTPTASPAADSAASTAELTDEVQAPEPAAKKEVTQLMGEAAESMGIPTGRIAGNVIDAVFPGEQFNQLHPRVQARLLELRRASVLTADQTIELFHLCKLDFNQQNFLGRIDVINNATHLSPAVRAHAIEAVQSVNRQVLAILGKKTGDKWTGEELIRNYYSRIEAGETNPAGLFTNQDDLNQLILIASSDPRSLEKFPNLGINAFLSIFILLQQLADKVSGPQGQSGGYPG